MLWCCLVMYHGQWTIRVAKLKWIRYKSVRAVIKTIYSTGATAMTTEALPSWAWCLTCREAEGNTCCNPNHSWQVHPKCLHGCHWKDGYIFFTVTKPKHLHQPQWIFFLTCGAHGFNVCRMTALAHVVPSAPPSHPYYCVRSNTRTVKKTTDRTLWYCFRQEQYKYTMIAINLFINMRMDGVISHITLALASTRRLLYPHTSIRFSRYGTKTATVWLMPLCIAYEAFIAMVISGHRALTSLPVAWQAHFRLLKLCAAFPRIYLGCKTCSDKVDPRPLATFTNLCDISFGDLYEGLSILSCMLSFFCEVKPNLWG